MRRWERGPHDFIMPYLRGAAYRASNQVTIPSDVQARQDFNSLGDIMTQVSPSCPQQKASRTRARGEPAPSILTCRHQSAGHRHSAVLAHRSLYQPLFVSGRIRGSDLMRCSLNRCDVLLLGAGARTPIQATVRLRARALRLRPFPYISLCARHRHSVALWNREARGTAFPLPGLDTYGSITSYITDKFPLVIQRQSE